MGPIQFEASLLPDGSIQVPEDVRLKLRRASQAKVRVSLTPIEGLDNVEPDESAWEDLAHIGDHAFPGGPPDLAANHDRYLYDGSDEDRDR